MGLGPTPKGGVLAELARTFPWFPWHPKGCATRTESPGPMAPPGQGGDTVARGLVGAPMAPLGFILVSFTGKFADNLEWIG